MLVQFAARQQIEHNADTNLVDRKNRGHFGTPMVIAQFMVRLFPQVPMGQVQILDPGAGVGTLTAALCDRIAKLRSPREIFVEVWENDPRLIPRLQETMDKCRESLRSSGHSVEITIQVGDFVLAYADRRSLFCSGVEPRFDFVVMNPPYCKLRKDSLQAQAMSHVVHGQPNIYALFMALGVELLKPNGWLVAITPRSYFSGQYFRKFRQWFLNRMSPQQIHVFESRKDAFRKDGVLQENIILSASKTTQRDDVILTNCYGRDLKEGWREFRVPFSSVVDKNGVIRITNCQAERRLLDLIDEHPNRLSHFGLNISTGPVVSFRATEHLLRERNEQDSAPLLWSHNVRPFITRFSGRNGKPGHIRVSDDSMKLLLPTKRFVLLKRFTAKEERRRIVAGIFEETDSYSPYIGLENHLNYIHKPTGELTRHEAMGLAAILNSAAIDRYFRAVSGNTQVNAAEIRNIPLPDAERITDLGKRVFAMPEKDETQIERFVCNAYELLAGLVSALMEFQK